MNEAEVVAELNNFTEVLLAGISVFFTVISAYVAALNYFIGTANFAGRLCSFVFITIVLGMLSALMFGAQFTHQGLIDRLNEIREERGLSAAGRAVLANASADAMFGNALSMDDVIRTGVWSSAALIYIALAYLTFIHRWKTDVVPVQIQDAR